MQLTAAFRRLESRFYNRLPLCSGAIAFSTALIPRITLWKSLNLGNWKRREWKKSQEEQMAVG
jgi:hypothetical protein